MKHLQGLWQALRAGDCLELDEEEITSRGYIANRQDHRILITADDLQQRSDAL